MGAIKKAENVNRGVFYFITDAIKIAFSVWGIVLLLILAISALLFTARGGFFRYAPVMGRHAELWASIIDLFQVTFAIVVDSIKAIVVAIKHALGWFGAHLKSKPTHWVKVKPISARQLRRFIDNVTITCAPVHHTSELLSLAAQLAVGDKICPFLRSVVPLGKAGSIAQGLLGWASPGPDAEHNNCQPSTDNGGPGIECVYLGLGPIVADIVLAPLFAISILWLISRAYTKAKRQSNLDTAIKKSKATPSHPEAE